MTRAGKGEGACGEAGARRAYCTYFDSGFLAQGRVLIESIRRHEPTADVWVLALDRHCADQLRSEPVRVVEIEDLVHTFPGLAGARDDRSAVEFMFTLTPFLPLWILGRDAAVTRIMYVDADMMFFASPQPVWAELDRGNILLCEHGFPRFLNAYLRHGRFNVGVLAWVRSQPALDSLHWWAERCLEWCRDTPDAGRYADQGYLDAFPGRFPGVVVCAHPGINLAPWNWMDRDCRIDQGRVTVRGRPLVVFHFARLRRIWGDRLWSSGHLDYGVMPWGLRQAVYGVYLSALLRASRTTDAVRPSSKRSRGRAAATDLALRLTAGSDWWAVGGRLIAFPLSLGRYSGRCFALLRRVFRR